MANEIVAKELYACNGCIEEIPTHRARISCHSCPDYHLCANCFVIKNFGAPHTVSHQTLVLRTSGVVVPRPPGFSSRPGPALPPRSNISINTNSSTPTTTKQSIKPAEMQVPTANWGALWSVLKAPLEKKDKRGRKTNPAETSTGNEVEKRDASQDSMMSGGIVINQLPPSPPKSIRQGLERLDSQAPSYPQPASWEPLFEADSTPTPIFVALMSTIFGHLDPEHTGSLTPELYSDFLDLQGCELGSNIWKYAYESDGGEQSRDVADLELGLYYADLNISHTLRIRPKVGSPNSSFDETSSVVEERIKDSLRFSANMPMLSRQGFIDLSAIEYLRDPSKGHRYLILVVGKYRVWTELGEIPRSVLPENSYSKKVLADKMEAEPENFIPKVLLAEKLVREEEKEIESEKNEGYASEELSASSSPVLPTKLKGGEAKIEALRSGEKFDEENAAYKPTSSLPPALPRRSTGEKTKVGSLKKEESNEETVEIEGQGKTDAMIKISEAETQVDDQKGNSLASEEKKNEEKVELYKEE